MKANSENKKRGFGLRGASASPPPLSTGEGGNYPADNFSGIDQRVVCEPRRPYETGNKQIWSVLKSRARENRKTQTGAEEIMWQALRGSKLGHKIRRQHPIDIYIVDFVCIRKSVVIEIDGEYHSDHEQAKRDEHRTFILEQKGFKVIRFTNSQVMRDREAVLRKIKVILDAIPDENPRT